MGEAFAVRSKLCWPSLLTHRHKKEVKNEWSYNLKASFEGCLMVEGHRQCT